MIRSLFIQNYALIRQLNIDFVDGFTVITGETGAGKSILLGAIGLLAGNRADHGVLLNQEQKCVIEGHFNLDQTAFGLFFEENEIDFENPVIVRREISPGGKSRAFLNDTPVQLQILKDLGERILNIHSQHQTLLISGNRFQMQTLDAWCGNSDLLGNYSDVFKSYHDILKRIAVFEENIGRMAAEADYFGFLNSEFEQIKISTEEYTELENEQSLLQNAGQIGESIFGALQMLSESDDNIQSSLRRVENMLQGASVYLPALGELAERIRQTLIETSDIADSLNRLSSSAETNPVRLEQVNLRLDEYQRLMHKHKVQDVQQLLLVAEEINKKLETGLDLSLQLSTEQKLLAQVEVELHNLANQIEANRQNAIPVFCENILTLLAQLGMPDAAFEVVLAKSDQYRPDGINTIQFLFNANKGEKPQDLGVVVSGGEMSRVMLAIKSMTARRNLLPTIIFDEIDSGVSGEIAAKMGNILKKLSENHQVIAITHLPQIAARGDEHVQVVKTDAGDRMKTELLKLDSTQRVEAIARMISDEKITPSAIEMARELLFN
ncbi:MAG: DNA repair protein RecN [Bacteroidetes bacterium HGW-Bacteroidetes-6]|jgi:DNA repair protein RecN (Recombination protein N)|nr:MAG: DNA repair protein RecN [Bacteroidetes bacterium HGW-Bacteroidetes-6]